MADRDVTVDVLLRDKTAPGTTSVTRSMKKVESRGVEAARSVERSLARVHRAMASFQSKASGWAENGDSVGKRWSGRVLGAISGAVGAAAKAGSALAGSLAGGLEAAGPIISGAVKAAMVVGVAAAAPVVATGIAAAIMLGLGGGVIAIGIKAAMNAPAVQTAFAGLKEKAKTAFADFGKPFEGPLVRAAATFGGAIDKLAPQINQLGVIMAPVIDKLAPALTQFAINAMPGITKAVERSKPLFDALAEILPKLGTSVSKFFEIVSMNGPGTVQFLRDAGTLLGKLIEYTAMWILGMSLMYGAARQVFVQIGEVVRGFVMKALDTLGGFINGAAKAFGWIPGIGPKLKAAAQEFNQFRDQVNNALAGIHDRVVNVRYNLSTTGRGPTAAAGGGKIAGLSAAPDWRAAVSGLAAEFSGAGGAQFAGMPLTQRTGGPAEINVNNTVLLDGKPFREMTARAVTASERRSAWRAKVGKR